MYTLVESFLLRLQISIYWCLTCVLVISKWVHYFLLLSLSDWQICGTYPAVHQHISHLYHFLLFAGHDQSEVNYVLLPEVLDFAARLDHILTQPGGSLLVVGAVEPEEEHFCSW